MLYEQGKCHPVKKGYTYKLYLYNNNWEIQVYYKEVLIGANIIPVGYEPRFGIDVLDANLIDKTVARVIKNHNRR